MADSPEMSPLSSHCSSEFADDVKIEEREQSVDTVPSHDTHLQPPAKRRRTDRYSHQSTPIPLLDVPEDAGYISSDTSGSVPPSPIGERLMGLPDDDPLAHEQVTVCKWRDCPVGDLGNMDKLVSHIHDDHIGIRQKRYACEWEGCSRKDSSHASGYALKAHMRSHTREKPFYCALPECDRSFTRSDALAKHMRTVHETEALRPSDPVPKNHSSLPVKPQRLKLIVNSKPREDDHGNGEAEIDDDATIYTNTDAETEFLTAQPFQFPADVQFTEEELAMAPDQLFRLLRRQLHWTEEDGTDLRDEVQTLEAKRKEEWLAKELVLANVMEAELATAVDNNVPAPTIEKFVEDLPHPILPLSGPEPWYRKRPAPPEGNIT